MALFTSASFPGATAEQPSAGGTATPRLTTAINFSKSDGTTTVCSILFVRLLIASPS